jgi:hypothetical protein
MICDVGEPVGHKETLARWARWLRLGCPTTTNAAESVHGRLNTELGALRAYCRRLKVLERHVMTRYYERDSDERVRRRSVNAYHEIMTTGWSQPQDMFSRASWAFYQALHSTDPHGHVWMPKQWKFSDLDRDPGVPQVNDAPLGYTEGKCNEKLPRSWTGESQEVPVERPKVLALDSDIPDECRSLPDAVMPRPEDHDHNPRLTGRSDSRFYNAIGWNLVFAVHRVAFGGHWSNEQCKDTIAQVFVIGAPYYPGQGLALPLDDQLNWRHQVMDRYSLWDRL